MKLLEVKNLTKSFGKTEVLKNISFSLERGEVVSILGISGGGKTTLLRCLNFIEVPDGGEIIFDGKTIFNEELKNSKNYEKTLRTKRLNFGLVFQQFNLFPQYTVLKNITLAPQVLESERIKNEKKYLKEEIKILKKKIFNLKIKNKQNHQEEIKDLEERIEKKTKEIKVNLKIEKQNSKKEIEENAKKLIAQVGLEDKVDFYPYQLSGGQQQRVAIARALALNPSILCFDEPTSALDPALKGEVLKAITSLKSNERAMLVVTHEMDFAKNISDRIIFISKGEIIENATPKEFFESKNPITMEFLNNGEKN